MSSIIVRNLADQLVELVRDRILSGEVPAGLPIRQDALASELGVSKIPLREALTRLEQEGLLRLKANRGFFVRPLTTEEAEEVYALRLKLEPEAVAEAAARANDDERMLAVKSLETLDRVTNAHGQNVGAVNRAFHLALVRTAEHPITMTIIERLHILSERYVRKHLEPSGRDERANDEHRRMLETWLSRDGAEAAAQARAHIEQTLKDLRRHCRPNDKNRSRDTPARESKRVVSTIVHAANPPRLNRPAHPAFRPFHDPRRNHTPTSITAATIPNGSQIRAPTSHLVPSQRFKPVAKIQSRNTA